MALNANEAVSGTAKTLERVTMYIHAVLRRSDERRRLTIRYRNALGELRA